MLSVLLVAALLAAWGLPLLAVAPNRLMTGEGVWLASLPAARRAWSWIPLALLVVPLLARPTRGVRVVVAVAATLALAQLVWIAGDEATRRSAQLSELARVSLGGGFWVLATLAWLAAVDAIEGLGLGPAWATPLAVTVVAPALGLLAVGHLDQLALLKEYAHRQDVFDAACRRHLELVLATLVPALLAGVPLGIAAARDPRFARIVLAVLNVVQTVPSIALFGLLIAPLAWLGGVFPGTGIRGVGLLPAVIALTLYALLPIVHGTVAGLRQVPAAAVEAARGMGMTPRQVFWRVEAPLALPVLLSGLRVTTVQVIGLAVLAALVGAGGLGTLVFQGLLGSALDLVLLGVLPVVGLALVTDAGFRVLAALLGRGPR